MSGLPTVDVTALRLGHDPAGVATAIDEACRDPGFFYVCGHGIDPGLVADVFAGARQFFALPDAEKAEIHMSKGGRAWRGWFPLGGELTSGVADGKEGIYLGADLDAGDPRVQAGLPLHGPNLFPRRPPELRAAVTSYLAALTRLGHVLCEGVGLALGLPPGWFREHLTFDPVVLFRIFRYPPGEAAWGVGEHTDYGLLTILAQDGTGGLEVRTPGGWIEVPPIEGAFVCNLGDMLERMTGGRYRSTAHRVRVPGEVERLSLAFFFDPAWNAEVAPLPGRGRGPAGGGPRWDGADVFEFSGTYGDYLLTKVRKVFPALAEGVLGPGAPSELGAPRVPD